MIAMNDQLLEKLIRDQLVDFEKIDPINAVNIKKALKKRDEDDCETDLIFWWKKQDPLWIAALQSFMFWLWQEEKIEYKQFEDDYYILTPILSKSWNIPVVITTGIDDPIFEGGFLEHNFSIFQYQFSPSDKGFVIKCQEYPPHLEASPLSLDTVLDFLSFVLGKSNLGFLGFRQINSRKFHSSETALISGGLGPEIQILKDYDFHIIEGALKNIELEKPKKGLSLLELLHVRHRAILDSNLESKLIALYSSIEAQWGEEDKQDKQDKLLTSEECKKIKKALNFLSKEKFNKIIDLINNLKSKTRNDKIVEGICKLQNAEEPDVRSMVIHIHKLRSKFAHGGIMNPNDQKTIGGYISFMLGILDKLITQKLAEYNIKFP